MKEIKKKKKQPRDQNENIINERYQTFRLNLYHLTNIKYIRTKVKSIFLLTNLGNV